jgi:hypothetical protein
MEEGFGHTLMIEPVEISLRGRRQLIAKRRIKINKFDRVEVKA